MSEVFKQKGLWMMVKLTESILALLTVFLVPLSFLRIV